MRSQKIKKLEDVKKPVGGLKKEWYSLTLAEVVDKLKVKETGLTQKNIERRRRRHGLNKLPDTPPTAAIILFLRQFKNSFTYILLIAAGISFYLDDDLDA